MILNMTEEYEKKNRYVPKFDEILFLGAIPPQNIERIGQWYHGIFTPQIHLKNT